MGGIKDSTIDLRQYDERQIEYIRRKSNLRVIKDKERCCLKCDTVFTSEGGSRVCVPCKYNNLNSGISQTWGW